MALLASSILLLLLLIEPTVSQTNLNDHSGHPHTFAKLARKKNEFGPKQPRVKTLDSQINDTVQAFKRNVLRLRKNPKLDLIFVIDASYSVRLQNFKDEIRFVSRFVGGIPVSMDTTRVAVVTFADSAKTWVDQVTANNIHDHKCSLLATSLPTITYASGSTYTLGGLEQAQAIMDNARVDSKKVVLLITDGESNGGDPRSIARRLRARGVEIFTFGVVSGNVEELTSMASLPKEDHVYILKSFAEFESVARRALHADAERGEYVTEESSFCDRFCTTEGHCCHSLGACRCGTTTGLYECVCNVGYFGYGLLPDGCTACPENTYKPLPTPGGLESCLPCPDENMVSANGSSLLSQCVCLTGYLRVDNRCEIVRCAVISTPLNGRFDGGNCDNRYRSVCHAFCDEGYDLVGSSSFTCGLDGTWRTQEGQETEESFCQIRHCPELQPPSHAILNCSKQDASYQTQCEIHCENGFALNGSANRYCQANMRWDGIESTCEEIRCFVPSEPLGGSISQNCLRNFNTTLSYGTTCLLSCPEGFALTVSNQTTCVGMDTWSTATAYAECIDVQAPTVECPDNIEVIANPFSTTTKVSWVAANTSDNSDNVSLTVIPELELPALFHIGLFEIIYRAEDVEGLVSFCNFTVTVIDNEPPMIDKCEDPEPFVISRDENVVNNAVWEDPTFSDNSGIVIINRSREFGDLPFGQTRVVYQAMDPTGNVRTCVITASVQNDLCPTLNDPKYGYKRCSVTYENLLGCELLCDSKRYGMALQERGTPFHLCTDEGSWDPSYNIIKDCSHQRYASEIIKGFRVHYTMVTRDTCNDTQFIESVKLQFVNYLTRRVTLWCTRASVDIVCTLLSVEVSCIAEEPPTPEIPTDAAEIHDGGDGYYNSESYSYDYDEEEYGRRKKRGARTRHKTRKILNRFKRQSRGDEEDYEPDPPADHGGISDENSDIPDESDSFTDTVDLPDDVILRVVGADNDMINKLEVTANVLGKVVLNDEDVVASRKTHGKMSEFFGQLNVEQEFTNALTSVQVRHINTSEIDYIAYQSDSYTASNGELKCPIGSVLRESASCVNCPVGTYFDLVNSDCRSCETGYYQDDEAQLSCKPCPVQTSTAGVHARSVEECKNMCGLGSYSPNGLETCLACPLHTYGELFGATECTACPENTGTAVRGAISPEQCQDLCHAGFASINGLEPCYPCPENTYQFRAGSQSCYECPGETEAAIKGSTSYQDCTGIDRILSIEMILPSDIDEEQILNLIVNSTKEFSDCFKDPCLNGATCESNGAGHLCTCLPGYSGGNCEIEINECSSNPCQNGASCLDLVNSFNCSCPDGYQGVLCEIETNECEIAPCLNNATCIDKLATFQCDCLNGFDGKLCEHNIDDCTSEPCSNGGTCVDKIADFLCICSTGFDGKSCENNIDECTPLPCLNEATCMDGINNFTCQCVNGFEGRTCETNIDDCIGNSCENGGTCLDLVDQYRCVCAPTFTGEHCDTELFPDFDLSFSKPNTYHHVKLRDGIRNATEVTVAFFMKSSNTETSGTPFSYAVGNGVLADVLTLTNLEALTLYVNGEAVVTDTRKLNDGVWYHVVVTWKSEGGEWKIYLNNQLEVEGSGLQPNTVIPGGGVLVIGQEQDCLGGCFSSSQEFIGIMSQFNFFDYVMSNEEINLLFSHCVGNKGTIKAWPDALGGIIGQVDVRKPSLYCRKCPDVITIPYLNFDAQNNYTGILSCDVGFSLYLVAGRRPIRLRFQTPKLYCGNRGKWFRLGRVRNPSSDFDCRRNQCNMYETIESGSTTATGSSYNDTVTYTCNNGFRLEGSETIVCQADQSWSDGAPSCVDIDECSYNSCHAMAACSNIVGSFQCVCRNGFTGDGIQCVEINCGDPGVLENGEIFGHNFTFGATIEFSCHTGYELVGDEVTTCSASRTWLPGIPVCSIIECEEPLPAPNATIRKTSNTYLSEIHFECDLGFEMNGTSSRICLENKKWSGKPPVCFRVQCPIPPSILNAVSSIAHSRSYYFGDAFTYRCDRGYRLAGDGEIRCDENGKWNSTNPTCMPVSCGAPVAIENGYFEGNGTFYHESVRYKCRTGFYLVGRAVFGCLATEQWGNTDTGILTSPPSCLPVPCGRPNHVANAYFLLLGEDDFVFGSYVKYECNKGYIAVGEENNFCDANGVWNSTENAFRCDPVPCEDSAVILNGVIISYPTAKDNGRFVFGHSIEYICNEGFYLNGEVESHCQSNGNWSQLPPNCEPIHCLIPPAVERATVNLEHGPHESGPRYESTLVYSCHRGYRLSNVTHHSRVCGSDGEWTGTTPVCEIENCGEPPPPSIHGQQVGNQTVYGSEVLYFCDAGYNTNANFISINCTDNGSWSSLSIPPCLPVECGSPENVTNGKYNGKSFNYLQHVNYTCDLGYQVFGSFILACQADGTWNYDAPECIPIDCDVPKEIDHGVVDFRDTVFQSFVNYICFDGYEILGPATLECLWNGSWSGLNPDCIPVNCGSPETIANGHVIGDRHTYQSVVHFICNLGYIRNGSENSTCLATAEWSSSLPSCEPLDCGEPPNVFNAKSNWDGMSSIFGTQIQYECIEGYESIDQNALSISCQDHGNWSVPSSCDKVRCETPTIPHHGAISIPIKSVYEFEDAVTYTCDAGYETTEPLSAVCRANKLWSNPSPACEPVNCGKLADILHGSRSGNDTIFASIVTYQCNEGYESSDSMTLECLARGVWNNLLPVCNPINCGIPPPVQNGKHSGGESFDVQMFMDEVKYICNGGFFIVGASTARCHADRLWKFEVETDQTEPPKRPVCRKITCGPPPEIRNATVLNHTYTFNESVIYTCNTGYEKSVNAFDEFYCTAQEGDTEGYFAGFPPVCLPITCNDPPPTEKGHFVTTGIKFQNHATYFCNKGYYLLGQSFSVCQANRQWSQVPSCLPRDCGQPPAIDNAVANVTSTVYPALLQYNCNIGYQLQGSAILECLSNGNWSDWTNSSCDPISCGLPPSVKNSTYFQTGTFFGDKVTYRCSEGFAIEPPIKSMLITLECQSNAEWEGVTFACHPRTCERASAILHGSAKMFLASWSYSSLESVYFPDIIEYQCESGYRMNTSKFLQCLSDATFNSTPPSCYPEVCGPPPSVRNAALTFTGTTFGHNVTYTCNYGYIIRNSTDELSTIASGCDEHGNWNPPLITECVRTICPFPPEIANGKLIEKSTSSFMYGDIATYSCNLGYQEDDALLSLRCQANKSWTALPLCKPVNCGIPECPSLALCNQTGITYQHQGFVQCVPGHEFASNITGYETTCLENAKWSLPSFNPRSVDTTSCRLHSCGSPAEISEGTYALVNGSTKYQANVTYTCNPGHEMINGTLNVLHCMENKQWGPSQDPICIPKDCGIVTCPPKATCESDGTLYGSHFRVICNAGYELFPDTTEIELRCLQTGLWTDAPFENLNCHAVFCPVPTAALHSVISSKNSGEQVEYQEKVIYECDVGFQMRGSSILTCLENKLYSSSPPTCQPITCDEPPMVGNSKVEFSGTTYFHNATYICNPGYEVTGESFWVCTSEGEWSPTVLFQESNFTTTRNVIASLPICEPVSCGIPPEVQNGFTFNSSNSIVFGESVSYNCNKGFYITGSHSLHCTEDGSFDAVDGAPVCERLSCGSPPDIMHAHFTSSSVTGVALNVFEDRITYFCDIGYEFQASSPISMIICASNGSWTPAGPSTCLPVSCGTPPTSEHVLIFGSDYTFNRTVTYGCENGYNLTGPLERVCFSNRRWSLLDHQSQCKPILCQIPFSISNGHFSGNFTFFSTVTYSCDTGYELHVKDTDTESSVLVCQASGQWSHKAPTCMPVPCGLPPTVPNAAVFGSLFTYGNEVVYTCDVGYEIKENPVIICLSNRTWSSPLPECAPVMCDHPPHVENSEYEIGSVIHGNSVTYNCNEGYELLGPSDVLTCTVFETFDYPPPSCNPVSCGEPSPPLNGKVEKLSSGITYLHLATYICDLGYEFEPGDTFKDAVCTADGVWSTNPPDCHPVDCGSPPNIENGNVVSDSDDFSSLAVYMCISGYEIWDGGETIFENCSSTEACLTCRADHKWGNAVFQEEPPVLPTCLPVVCGEPPKVDHGRMTVDGQSFEDTAVYSCNDGYEIYPHNASILSCGADHNWGQGHPPICRRVTCPLPSRINDGYFQSASSTSGLVANAVEEHGFLFGDAITYKCNPGYKFIEANQSVQNIFVTCLASQSWDRSEPNCEPVSCGYPPKRHHGSLLSKFVNKTFVFSDVVEYVCDKGYDAKDMSTNETLTCTKTGRWSKSVPSLCEPVSCGSEPYVMHGLLLETTEILRARSFRTMLHYGCFDGYFMMGNDEVRCQWDKSWSSIPTCKPVSCNLPPVIPHGHPVHQSSIPSFGPFPLSGVSSGEHIIEDIFHASGDSSIHHIPMPIESLNSSDQTVASNAQLHRSQRSLPSSDQASFTIKTRDFVFGDAVHYVCDPGHRHNSSRPDSLICKENGQWSSPKPICEPISCNPPPNIQNGTLIGDNFKYGQRIHYECNEGHEFSKNTSSLYVCDETGRYQAVSNTTWDRPPSTIYPTCHRVSCGPTINVSNGRIVSGNTEESNFYQDTVQYACNNGYRMRGAAELVCQSNKRYNFPAPVCEIVSCGIPPELPYADVNAASFSYRHTATYHCNEGYQHNTENETSITCGEDGHWSFTSLVCRRRDCGSPPHLNFGTMDITGTKYGDTATYSCLPGYELSGNISRICLSSGNWSSACPTCSPIPCDTPIELENGFHVKQKNYTYGHFIFYHCNEGYTLFGDDYAICDEEGEWSSAAPECNRISCGMWPTVENTEQAREDAFFGDQITYECAFGYVMSGNPSLYCASNGTFHGQVPTCSPLLCSELPSLPNAHLVSDGPYHFGDAALFHCDSGYESTMDSIQMLCTGFTVFENVSDFSCIPVLCPILDYIDGGHVSKYIGSFDDTVHYTCDNGYQLQGPETLTCKENAKWSDNPPTCLPISCGPAPVYPNAVIISQNTRYTFGMKVHYDCVEGYLMSEINGHMKTCLGNGNFTPGEINCQPVTCQEYFPIPNGVISGSGLTYMSLHTISCTSGYAFDTGEEEIALHCQANGTWSHDFLSVHCNPVSIESLPAFRDGVLEVMEVAGEDQHLNGVARLRSLGQLFYGDQVSYKCNEGYTMNGNDVLRSLPNGGWTSSPPECLPVDCGEAPSEPNTHATGHNYTFGMSATYTCNEGFVNVSDNMTRTCEADGNFSQNSIECERRSCGLVPLLNNGSASAEDGYFKDAVFYWCNPGYELVGNETIECDYRGKWISSLPICFPIKCPALPSIPHATFFSNGTQFQDEAVFQCDPGFVIDDENNNNLSIVCLENKTWSKNITELKCTPVRCESITVIQNGEMIVIPSLHDSGVVNPQNRLHAYETRLSFKCNSGYNLRGPQRITCKANRVWDSSSPKCEPVKCHRPQSVMNAHLTTDNHTFGQKAMYQCDDGYIFTSKRNYRICNENGSYSNYEIVCSPRPCENPPSIRNGYVSSQKQSVFGDRIEIACKNGYFLQGAAELRCLETGLWSDNNATCKPVLCGIPPEIDNAFRVNGTSEQQYVFQDEVEYECEEGFRLIGSNDILVCEANGTFENGTIICEPITCTLSEIQNATVSGTNASYGDSLRITCNPGYKLPGDQLEITVACQNEGTWSIDAASITCTPVDCEPLEPLQFGEHRLSLANGVYRPLPTNESITLLYPAAVVYRCDHGYILLGRSKRHCLADGSWDGSMPFCQPVDCGILPRLIHGSISGSTTTSGSIAIYECDVGYQLDPADATDRICQETGSWSGIPPLCRLVNCGIHPSVDHAVLSTEVALPYGFSVEIECERGYELSGNSTRFCEATGDFGGDLPVCTPISCGLHPIIENGVVEPELSFLYQESVNVSCLDGYHITGSGNRVCQHDGTWSGIFPVCEIELERLYDDYTLPSLCEKPDIKGLHIKLLSNDDLDEYYESGILLKFRCKYGYISENDTSMICQNGKWSNTPKCLPACKYKCLHRGKCGMIGKCSCKNGWSGSKCHRPTCPLPCLNRGYCSAPFHCACSKGWTGSRCQTATCNPHCANDGKCIGPNLCQCPYGYFGRDCSRHYFFNRFW